MRCQANYILDNTMVAAIGNKLKVDRPIYEILQVLSIKLLDKTPLGEKLTKCDYKMSKKNKLIN